MDFEKELKVCAEDMEGGLAAVLSSDNWQGGMRPPDRLMEAMRHGARGGKRIRPMLVRQAAALFGVSARRSLATSIGVELVHCYSLIHDDLPAMDDDDLRRGRPTVHKAFDEATAILAGDGLLTLAFGWLAEGAHGDGDVRAKLVAELATGAGVIGMVGGQMRDIEAADGGYSDEDVAEMQLMKTGALIRASVRMGAIIGEADEMSLEALTRYGEAAGRAFQIADDLLDMTSTPEAVGKATGKDSAGGKATLAGRIGVEAAQGYLEKLTGQAIEALAGWGEEADGLREAAKYIATRKS